MERSKAAMQQESDIDLARAAIPSGIKQLEGFHVAFPGNRRLQALLAEAVCGYGAGFVQDDWEAATLANRSEEIARVRDHARKMLGRCVNYGLMLLDPAWSEALWRDPDALAPLIARAERSQTAGVFWVGLGLASLAGMFPDDPALMAHLGPAQEMLERVIELDEGFSDGLAHMTLGILHSSRSASVGGDPERGKRHFARARALTGGKSLMVDVMYARYHGVTTRDRELFVRHLIQVLRTSPAVWPENRLSNELAHRKARRYLAHRLRWFD